MKDKVSETLTSFGESKPSYPSNYRGNMNSSSGYNSVPVRATGSDSYAAAKNVTYEEGLGSTSVLLLLTLVLNHVILARSGQEGG